MTQSLAELSPRECRTLLTGLALASQVFWGPSPESCADMAGTDFIKDLMAVADMLGPEEGRPAVDMANFLSGCPSAGELYAQLEPCYVGLFVNAKGGIPAPLYQSCYDSEEGFLMGRPAQMMQQRLAQAGVGLAQDADQPPDHLAVELEYLFLVLETAFNQDDPALMTEARDFAAGEMLPWLEQFCRKVLARDDSQFYGDAASLMKSLVSVAAT